MKKTRVARRYANALMSLAEELKVVDRLAADMEMVGLTLRGSREFRLFLASPVVSRPRKKKVIKELFGAAVAAPTFAFVNLLIDKQREAQLGEIVEQFAALRDERQGIVGAAVSSAVELTPAQQQEIKKRLEQYTRKNIRLQLVRDAGLRGGIVVRIGDTVLDASVRRQLERLRECFVATGTMTK
jgi:F-type H+-transporting ATPase subunit delta